MKMRKDEQQTLIRYNDEDDVALVETCNKRLQKLLDGFCARNPMMYQLDSVNGLSKTYFVPKESIVIRKPRKKGLCG